ncbi:MAG: hypothetical protein LBI84_03995 [Propionibacteriaceae bacterium]|jgi:hypothetical protein|nr:hypothetical protein [Propionibacteriaceae bacterium]
MARRVSKHLAPPRPLSSSHASFQTKADGRWIVRTMPGSQALKDYRCPGCGVVLRAGTAHVVVWADTAPLGSADPSGLADRRHWHTACWARRP